MPAKRKPFDWRPPRVRHEPPTITEAISAARDLSDEPEVQVELAAGLMGVAPEDVRAQMVAEPRRLTTRLVRRTGIVVEKRISRSAGLRRP